MKKTLIAALISLTILVQATEGIRVFGMNAKMWQLFNETEKILYTQGLFDGLAFSKFVVDDTKLSTKLSTEEYVAAVDKIYTDHRNVLIPVPFLLRIISLEVGGASKEEVEIELLKDRKQFATASK